MKDLRKGWSPQRSLLDPRSRYNRTIYGPTRTEERSNKGISMYLRSLLQAVSYSAWHADASRPSVVLLKLCFWFWKGDLRKGTTLQTLQTLEAHALSLFLDISDSLDYLSQIFEEQFDNLNCAVETSACGLNTVYLCVCRPPLMIY